MFKSWSNLDVTPQQQFACWREMLCDAFTELSPETTLSHTQFRGEILSQNLSDGLVMSSLSSQQQKIHRTESDITQAKEHYLFFNLQKKGSACIQQNHHATQVKEGDLYIVDTRSPYQIEQYHNEWQSLSLRIPIDHVAHCSMPLSGVIDHLNSIDQFVLYENILTLEKMIGKDFTGKTAAILTKTMLELVQANFENLQMSSESSFHQILKFIEHHAKNHDLRCADIAKAFHTSERNIYKIFEKENSSLSHTISDARLNHFLKSMQNQKGNITEFAYQSGFNDLSNFYKIFKRKFNETPKKYFAKKNQQDSL